MDEMDGHSCWSNNMDGWKFQSWDGYYYELNFGIKDLWVQTISA